MLYLTESDIADIVRKVSLQEICKEVHKRLLMKLKDKQFKTYQRKGFNFDTNLVEWMPGMQENGHVSLKVVSYFPNNPTKYNSNTIQAVIAKVSCEDGVCRLISEGNLVTAIRTGVASAVASELMAAESSSEVGLIGCGVQSVFQAYCLSLCFPVETIRAFDTNEQASASLQNRLKRVNLNLPVSIESPSSVVENSDIICTATSTLPFSPPVFSESSVLRAHCHINAVGSDCPGKTELPLSVLDKAFVVVDDIDQAKAEGECQDGRVSRYTELSNMLDMPSHSKNTLSVFDSTGTSLEDSVCISVFEDYAKDLDIGATLGQEKIKADIDPLTLL